MRRLTLVCLAALSMAAPVARGASLIGRPTAANSVSAVHHARSKSARRRVKHKKHRRVKHKRRDPVLFGHQPVEPTLGKNVGGLAEAFPFTNNATRSASSIVVYVAAGNEATTLVTGLYADRGGRPGPRIAFGSLTSPRAASWNSITIPTTAVKPGTYWLAVLGEGGTLYFRDRSAGRCVGDDYRHGRLTTLPAGWRVGPTRNACPISAYVTRSLTPSPSHPPVNTGAPTVSGSAVDGDTLTASTGSWTGHPTSYGYQWQNCTTNSLGLVCADISGATASSYTLTSGDVGHAIRSVVTATNAGGSTAASSAQSAVVTMLQPVGDPLGRTWTEVFDDEFNGTSIDTSKWVALNGWGNNNVTSSAKNCTESGGDLILALPGDGTGCDLYSSKKYGAGANAHDLLVGDYLEARIWFPGPGSSPTATLDNWPAFWAYDGSGNWLAGENDIAEALGKMEFNYHGSGSGHVYPSGNWGNSWHVYGIYRAATQDQVFYDGVLIGTVATSDNGGPESIMFTSGQTNVCCGAPAVYGPAGNVLVDWVREWN
jgi:hypothetical protein